MEIIFQSAVLAEFAHSVAFLARVGDELYWEVWPDKLVLSAINSSRSALAKCTFHAPFFRRFAVTARSGADEPVLECRVLNKVVQLLFKKRPGSVAHDVDEVILRHLPEENRLGFVFVCKHGITRTHKLTYEDCVAHDADIQDDRLQNEAVLKPESIANALGNLYSSLDELAWVVSPEALAIHSYVASEAIEERRVLHTRLRMPSEEFDVYNVGTPAYLIFALKEFKAMLGFAEAVKSTITVRFDDGGTPMVFLLNIADVIETRLTVSTRPRPAVAVPSGGAPSAQQQHHHHDAAPQQDDDGQLDNMDHDGGPDPADTGSAPAQAPRRVRPTGGDLQFPFRSSPASVDGGGGGGGTGGGSEPNLMPALDHGTPAAAANGVRGHSGSGGSTTTTSSPPAPKRARQ